jgi:hypothetical protein
MSTIWLSAADEANTGFDWTPVWTLIGAGLFALAGTWLGLRGNVRLSAVQEQIDARKWQREKRRQSYIDCIEAYERFRDLIEPVARITPWVTPRELTPEDNDRIDELIIQFATRYQEMFIRCQVVRLEGPESIALRAMKLLEAASDFRNAAEEGLRAARNGQRAGIRERSESSEQMRLELEEFIRIGREAISAK